MKISVHTDKMNSPKVYENAISSYEKGSFFCVQYKIYETENVVWYYEGVPIPKEIPISSPTKSKTMVDKYPIVSLFRVTEEY